MSVLYCVVNVIVSVMCCVYDVLTIQHTVYCVVNVLVSVLCLSVVPGCDKGPEQERLVPAVLVVMVVMVPPDDGWSRCDTIPPIFIITRGHVGT